jgi:hypothetical protein
LRRRNFVSDLEACAKGVIHFRRPEKMKGHFLASGAIDIKYRRARESCVLFKQTQRLPVLSKSGEKPRVLLPREADDAQLRDHNRPTEDGSDGEKRQDEFSCDRRVIERKKETAGR